MDGCKYSGTLVNVNTAEPWLMNVFHNEQIGSRTNFPNKAHLGVTNGVSSNEHASQQQRLATSLEYQRESISCSVTSAQYTSLLKFAVPSLEFHCVLWFFYILLNSLGLRTFRVTNGLQERIKFVNRGSTVLISFIIDQSANSLMDGIIHTNSPIQCCFPAMLR
jgi:hypothetical protein